MGDFSLSGRLQELIEFSTFSLRKFAFECGLKQSTFDKHVRGTAETNVTTLMGIANRFPEVSLDWLLVGRGEMLKENNQTELEMAHKTIADLQSAIADQALTIKYLKDRIKELESK